MTVIQLCQIKGADKKPCGRVARFWVMRGTTAWDPDGKGMKPSRTQKAACKTHADESNSEIIEAVKGQELVA